MHYNIALQYSIVYHALQYSSMHNTLQYSTMHYNIAVYTLHYYTAVYIMHNNIAPCTMHYNIHSESSQSCNPDWRPHETARRPNETAQTGRRQRNIIRNYSDEAKIVILKLHRSTIQEAGGQEAGGLWASFVKRTFIGNFVWASGL